MAQRQDAAWVGSGNAPGRADRADGPFQTYLPDPLVARPVTVPGDVAELGWRVETAVRRLGELPGARGLEGLARFLLRSEAIASSRIEGLEVSPQQVGLAELLAEEGLTPRKTNHTAVRVAANIDALRRATGELAGVDRVSVEDVEGLQRALLADEPGLHGLRTVQNWIGGSSWTPVGAEFVPPAPEHVRGLADDLVTYMNGGAEAPLVQAALVHAQFETLHPFRDGNGRVGRALIHTVLVRRGLTTRAVLPISPVLLTRSEEYVAGLTAYRYDGSVTSQEATRGTAAWLRVFLQAVGVAAEQAVAFAGSLDELRATWERALAEQRRALGLREAPRADSATARILETLQEHPVLTATTVMRLLDLSRPAATAAVEELAAAGILAKRRLDGRQSGYFATDVFDLITSAERRLASTRWDTADAGPSRPTPYGQPPTA